MKISSYRQQFVSALATLYDEDEAASFFLLLLEHRCNLRRIDLALDPRLSFADDDVKWFDGAMRQLQKFVPIQYIIGSTTFCGLKMMVNGNVLIPRPETEELVSWIISEAGQQRKLRVIDLGTGSGCIAVSLAKHLHQAVITGIDVSHAALNVAGQNAHNNHVDVNFVHLDILAAKTLPECDIIVSNPPYVREAEKSDMRENVTAHEPHLALFVPDENALVFYEKIALLATRSLSPGGRLFFEINQQLAKQTMDLLERLGFGALELRRDIFGNDRMVRGIWNEDHS